MTPITTRPRAFRWVLLALAILLLTACAAPSPQPLTLAEVPLYPEAVPLSAGANPAVESVADALLATQQQVKAELRRETLPAGATWPEVVGFYREELAQAGWVEADQLAAVNLTLNTAGFRRGEGESEQVLLLALLPPETVGEPVLLTALFGG